MTDRTYGPFPKPSPGNRIAGATLVGFTVGVILGAYHRPWSFTMLAGGAGALAAALAMVTKLSIEARHRRTHRVVVKEPVSNIVPIRREMSA